MKCGEVKKLFSDYLMLETDPETTEMIRGHISTCPGCRGELETSVALWTKLEVLPAELPGGNLKKGFYQMLEREMEKEKKGMKETGFSFDFFSRFFLQKRLFSPAALVLLVISAFILGIFVTSGPKGEAVTGNMIQGNGASTQVVNADQSGLLKIITAYEKLKSPDEQGPGTKLKKKDPGEMSFFEFFARSAFIFVEYFEKLVTL